MEVRDSCYINRNIVFGDNFLRRDFHGYGAKADFGHAFQNRK